MMQVSCGIILASSQGWLIGHSTGNKHWDFPKGLVEFDETHWQAVVRELKEETGLSFDLSMATYVTDLGRHSYTKGKDLHLYYAFLKEPLDVAQLKCSSMVELPNRVPFPELDKFIVKPPAVVIPLLGKSMQLWVSTHVPAELIDELVIHKIHEDFKHAS